MFLITLYVGMWMKPMSCSPYGVDSKPSSETSSDPFPPYPPREAKIQIPSSGIHSFLKESQDWKDASLILSVL